MKYTKINDPSTLIKMLQELGISYQETIDLLSKAIKESRSTRRELGIGDDKASMSPLIKLGATMFLVPIPVVTEVLGMILISAGLIQSKVKGPILQINDVYKTFSQINKELKKIRLNLD